jgi:hypothetical protein
VKWLAKLWDSLLSRIVCDHEGHWQVTVDDRGYNCAACNRCGYQITFDLPEDE